MLLKRNIPLKYVFGKIKVELLVIGFYSAIITAIYEHANLAAFSMPLSVPMIMGTVISLLLAFRSNQAYDRWWEARTIWGAIVNDSRTIARQIKTLAKEAYQGDDLFFFKQRFINRQIAWCYSLNQSLREKNGSEGLERLLTKRDVGFLLNYTNKPMALLELHGADLQQAYDNKWINAYQQVEIDRTITRLCDAMGKCERIKNTVFPATYSLYIHFSMVVFFTLLPFALIEVFGVIMFIPAMLAIGAIFFLVEKMAIHLQDPFENKPTDTPMTAICNTIERDLKQVISDTVGNGELARAEKKVYYVL